jgi:uncharacterized membrane protein
MSQETQSPDPACPPPSPGRISETGRPTRQELITGIAHFYRGEMHRTLVWRTRLDTTTHWAIVSTLAVLTFSLNNPDYSQETLLAGMFANVVFLLYEARRFRFFDVWRARLRVIEECFYAPLLRGEGHCAVADWREKLAQDLLCPRFKITLAQAIRARFLRNYIFVFAFLLLAWAGRLVGLDPGGDRATRDLLAIGGFPWWVGPVLVALVYLGLLGIVLFTPKVKRPEVGYWADPLRGGQEVPDLDV